MIRMNAGKEGARHDGGDRDLLDSKTNFSSRALETPASAWTTRRKLYRGAADQLEAIRIAWEG